MQPRACLLALTAMFASSCVTSGGGSEGTAAIGAVMVFSHIAQAASSGDEGAKKTWCNALDLVETRSSALLATLGNGQILTDDELTEKVIPDMHNVMRQGGYQLHHKQLAIVVRDALNVLRDDTAKTAAKKSCK